MNNTPIYLPQQQLQTLDKVKQALLQALQQMHLAPKKKQYWQQHIEQAYQLKRARYYLDYHCQRWQQEVNTYLSQSSKAKQTKTLNQGGPHGTDRKQTQQNQ